MSDLTDAKFLLLHPRIQAWVAAERWPRLRSIQEQAIGFVLKHSGDAILAAATASGKTEAAFLPLLSQLLQSNKVDGILLYISPLKALIDDQHLRLERLTEDLGIEVTAWHGDASTARKRSFLKRPSGVLLITPESLEALFVLHSHALPAIANNLLAVVVDELHAFLGSARGRQVQSLLDRLQHYRPGRPVRRLALSATLGDMEGPRQFLRPSAPETVTILRAEETSLNLSMNVNAVVADGEEALTHVLVEELAERSQTEHHLIFPNSRKNVEDLTERLAAYAADRQRPVSYFAHHGNLSKDPRSEAETALRGSGGAVSVICTSTLELGIDIGNVYSVFQVGPPPTVASLRQRLGRSGRREGQRSILRGLAPEHTEPELDDPDCFLRPDLVRLIASCQLIELRWNEPILSDNTHYSTLIQQILSTIYEMGGATAEQVIDRLCESGPFLAVEKDAFTRLIAHLKALEVLQQEDQTGLLLAGPKGERMVESYASHFFAAFKTTQEFRVLAGHRLLGTLPMTNPLQAGQPLTFAGKRWRVAYVDTEQRVVGVDVGVTGKAPLFSPSMGLIHERVMHTMHQLYMKPAPLNWITQSSFHLLEQASNHFHRLGLSESSVVPFARDTAIFSWLGDPGKRSLALMLRACGLTIQEHQLYLLVIQQSSSQTSEILRRLARQPISEASIRQHFAASAVEKWDHLVPEDLLDQEQFRRYTDSASAYKWIQLNFS